MNRRDLSSLHLYKLTIDDQSELKIKLKGHTSHISKGSLDFFFFTQIHMD